jgi:class 3 adenylate cyclase
MPAADGERRLVTVLFADVTGATELADRLDVEDFQLVMRDTMAALAACVRAEGGHVEKFIGDALCAVFGAPVAHEDEPERAIRAARAMHDELARLAEQRPELPPLTVHIGINTGLVISGGVGDGTQFGVMGDAINTAARVMELAGSGRTLVTADTARRVRRRVRLVDRGAHPVKGKSRPLPVFEVVGAVEEAPARSGLHAPMIGRDGELAALREWLATGTGGRMAITGEAGLGKTRLVDELVVCDEVRERWRLLRSSARLAGDQPLALVRNVLDALAVEADRSPLLVVLDDVDRADDGSVLTVARLAGGAVGDRPVAWLMVGRRLPAPLADVPDVRTLRLGPLDRQGTAALLAELLPGALDPAQAKRLARRSDGNPTFTEEIALALVDESMAVSVGDGSFRLTADPDGLPIPATVTEMIEARIDGLATATRATLQDAAVIGVRFRRRLLAQVSTVPDALDAALADLVVEELVVPPEGADEVEGAGGFWSFRGELIRDVAYHGLLRRRRQSAHRSVAEALVALEPESVDANSELLAHHLELSDEPMRALPFLERSYRHALAAGSESGAEAVARRARAIAERDPESVASFEPAWFDRS